MMMMIGGLHRALIPILLLSAMRIEPVSALDSLELVVKLAPFLNWPAIEIPALYIDHDEAAAAVAGDVYAGQMPLCLVRSFEVQDEALWFLNRISRSSMSSACAWIAQQPPSESSLRRALALASILALFRIMTPGPEPLDHLQAVVDDVRQQMRASLGLGSDQFIDLLTHVFVRDVGRLLHRIVWSDQGLGSSDPDALIEFIRARYLSNTRLAPMLQLYGNEPSPSYSPLIWAMITMFRLIPFPDQIELLGPESTSIMAKVRHLQTSRDLIMPSSLSVSWSGVRDALYDILDHCDADEITALRVTNPNLTVFDPLAFAVHSFAGVTNMPGASLEQRLARCVALRLVVVLLGHLSHSDLFPSLDVAALVHRASGRYYQEVYELLHDRIPLDIMHYILHFVRNFVDVSLVKMTQLNLSMFLSRDRPYKLESKGTPDLTGFFTQLQPLVKVARAMTSSPASVEFLRGIDSTLASISSSRSAPDEETSRFCRDLMEVAFRTGDHINPFVTDTALHEYQTDALAKFPAELDSDRYALLADYLSLRAIDLAFGEESVYTLTMERLKEMNKDIDLLRFMDDHDSLHRTQLILLRLSDLRSDRQPSLISASTPDAQAGSDLFSTINWEMGSSSASAQTPSTTETIAYCSPSPMNDQSTGDHYAPPTHTDAQLSIRTSMSASADPYPPSGYATYQQTTISMDYGSPAEVVDLNHHPSEYVAATPSSFTVDHLASTTSSEQLSSGHYGVTSYHGSGQVSSISTYSFVPTPTPTPISIRSPRLYPMPMPAMPISHPTVAYYGPPPMGPPPMYSMPVPLQQGFMPAPSPAYYPDSARPMHGLMVLSPPY